MALGLQRRIFPEVNEATLESLRKFPWQVLSLNERNRIRSYLWEYHKLPLHRQCLPQDLLVHVGDDPSNEGGWCIWSGTNNRLPTLRRSGGMHVAPFQDRYVILKELYLAMGFPTMLWIAEKVQTPVYPVFRPLVPYGDALKALGNSQHVAQVGIFTGCCLMCIAAR